MKINQQNISQRVVTGSCSLYEGRQSQFEGVVNVSDSLFNQPSLFSKQRRETHEPILALLGLQDLPLRFGASFGELCFPSFPWILLSQIWIHQLFLLESRISTLIQNYRCISNFHWKQCFCYPTLLFLLLFFPEITWSGFFLLHIYFIQVFKCITTKVINKVSCHILFAFVIWLLHLLYYELLSTSMNTTLCVCWLNTVTWYLCSRFYLTNFVPGKFDLLSL